MFLDIIKKFQDWSKIKINIHLSNNTTIYFKERQIWWVSLGQNIGREQNGKDKKFERPVLILKKFNPEIFLAVPLSTQIKQGPYRYIFIRDGKQYMDNLSQIRILSSKRLLRQLGKFAKLDYQNIKSLFKQLI